jgi:hypothetical protein
LFSFIAWGGKKEERKKERKKGPKNKALTPFCQYWLEGTALYDNDQLLVLRI